MNVGKKEREESVIVIYYVMFVSISQLDLC